MRFIMETVLILCGLFYALLCVFSIATGLIYVSGKKQLNPLELSDRFMQRLSDPEKRRRFTVRMGWVTVLVGLVQGLTAYALFRRGSPLFYGIALGFTLFSIGSVAWKLKGKISTFALLKSGAYTAILLVLLLKSSRVLFLV